MPSGTDKFTGDGSVLRFFSSNRPSTDALSVLHLWRDLQAGRDFEIIDDSDYHLVASLTLEEDDGEAGPQLQALSTTHGVRHDFIPSN